MPPRNVVTALACLWLLVASSFGELKAGQGQDRITNFRTQLAGTIWKAPPGALRPGLGGMLMFTRTNVESAGYRYEVNGANSLTLFFNHGDKQIFQLSPDGQHLQLTFKGKRFTYELFAAGEPDQSLFRTKLAGSTWKAAMKPLRPGLVETLQFTAATVGPAAYLYCVDGTEMLTLYFDYGDSQPMLLSPDGKRLSFVWKGNAYAYDRVGG